MMERFRSAGADRAGADGAGADGVSDPTDGGGGFGASDLGGKYLFYGALFQRCWAQKVVEFHPVEVVFG